MLFVLVGSINHVLVNVKHGASIDEERIEPEVERWSVSVKELDPYIVINKQVLSSDVKVIVRDAPEAIELDILYLRPIIEYMSLADDLKVGDYATFVEVRYCDHSNFVDLLHDSFVCALDRLFGISLLHLQEVLEIVYIAYLRWDRNTVLISCANLAVVNKRLEGGSADARVDEIAADHDTCATFSSFTVNSNYIIWVLREELGNVFAEFI